MVALGENPSALRGLIDGSHDFASRLGEAERPMVIVGQGALMRPDGAAMLAAAWKLASGIGALTLDWHGFNVLHTAAARVGALDLGFVPDAGGKGLAAMMQDGVDLLWLLGADEFDTAAIGADTFVVYQGHHGDRGAARADVILPGAAYTEKNGTYVNTEGRVQRGFLATFPPGEAREDWRIIRALQRAGRRGARIRHARAVAGEDGRGPSELRARLCPPGRDRSGRAARRPGGALGRADHPRDRGLLSDQPDQPGERHHAGMQPHLHAWRRDRGPEAGGRVMRDFFFHTLFGQLILIVLEALAILVPLLIMVAYLTLAERKVLAAMQLRKGPNVVGPFGLFQPFADAIKMLMKETIIPMGSNRLLFLMAPMLTFTLAMIAWAVIPVNNGWAVADINVGVLYLFAISSLGVYGIIIAGWASNSKYAFLGALRSAAQMVSYEVSMGFVMVSVLLCAGSLRLNDIVTAQSHIWFFIPLFPMFIVFIISALAETNRSPFDLPEGESEIVAGFFVEYSAMAFALFFLGEYANIILMSGMTSILFLGGWLSPIPFEPFTWIPGPIWFILKICVCVFIFLWVRATLPRFRYDQLMRLGWKVFLPLSLVWLVITAGVLMATGWLPVHAAT